eukprot:SAG11_NODE_1882_length_4128_cov_2.284438_7_plen_259_part_00
MASGGLPDSFYDTYKYDGGAQSIAAGSRKMISKSSLPNAAAGEPSRVSSHPNTPVESPSPARNFRRGAAKGRAHIVISDSDDDDDSDDCDGGGTAASKRQRTASTPESEEIQQAIHLSKQEADENARELRDLARAIEISRKETKTETSGRQQATAVDMASEQGSGWRHKSFGSESARGGRMIPVGRKSISSAQASAAAALRRAAMRRNPIESDEESAEETDEEDDLSDEDVGEDESAGLLLAQCESVSERLRENIRQM